MDNANRVFPFDSFAAATVSGPRIAPGVTIESRHVGSMWNVRGDVRDDIFLRDVSAAFHITLPAVPNTASRGDDVRVLWLGPDEWLIVNERPHPGPLPKQDRTVLTDVSHARAVLRLSGPDVRAALSKGCPLDLDPRAFPVDACAQTAIAKINVIVDHLHPGVYDLYCARSYAKSFWHWIVEAAAEYSFTTVTECLSRTLVRSPNDATR